jgi:hypothetical protein
MVMYQLNKFDDLRLLFVEDQTGSKGSPCGVYEGQCGTERFLSQHFSFHFSTIGQFTHYSTQHWHYQYQTRLKVTPVQWCILRIWYCIFINVKNIPGFSLLQLQWFLLRNALLGLRREYNFGNSLLLPLQKLHSIGFCSPVTVERIYQKMKTIRNRYVTYSGVPRGKFTPPPTSKELLGTPLVTYRVLPIFFKQSALLKTFCSILVWDADTEFLHCVCKWLTSVSILNTSSSQGAHTHYQNMVCFSVFSSLIRNQSMHHSIVFCSSNGLLSHLFLLIQFLYRDGQMGKKNFVVFSQVTFDLRNCLCPSLGTFLTLWCRVTHIWVIPHS